MSEDTNQVKVAPGTIGWNEIVTSDKGGATEFYTQLFGWTASEMEMPGGATYTIFNQGEREVAGCVVPPGVKDVNPMWLAYVNVEDIDASVAKAKELGATILADRVDLPMGSFTVLTDPQGATFALWQSNDSYES